jgi:transposase
MTLSYSRDPFCWFTASQDLGTFWDCHRRAFAHFGGVPAQIVYDRTKTVVRRHVGRGQATPLHPEAVAFASHYDFAIWLAAPTGPRPKAASNARSRSSAAMCWTAAASPRWPS